MSIPVQYRTLGLSLFIRIYICSIGLYSFHKGNELELYVQTAYSRLLYFLATHNDMQMLWAHNFEFHIVMWAFLLDGKQVYRVWINRETTGQLSPPSLCMYINFFNSQIELLSKVSSLCSDSYNGVFHTIYYQYLLHFTLSME